jgi:protein-disulfide isomerase
MKVTVLLKLAILSLFLISCGSQQNEASAQQQTETNAKVTLTEYSDYQCPACAYFHPIVDSLKQEFGTDLNIEYKYFPLNSHQYAALAARAAEAARNQGKFLEMHNMLFENQRQWSTSNNPISSIINYARELNLDMDKFTDELNAAETQQIVMEEKQAGVQLGVNSTPTFYINGEKVEQNPRTYDAFKSMIQTYMDESGDE